MTAPRAAPAALVRAPSIVAIAAAWLVGALCVHELPRLLPPAAYVPIALGALLALRHRRTHWLAFAIAGFVWTSLAAGERLAQRLPPEALGRDVAIAGWIDAFPTTAPGQATFSFAVDAPRPPGVPPRVRLTWYDPPASLAAGDAFELNARLRPPHGLRNPGGFDYERWLLQNGYGATGYVRSAEPAPHASRGMRRRWLEFRATLAERIAASAPDADAAALLTALAIGERHRFSEQHWADFRRTGTSHLVAVSGMHVALLGVVVFLLVRRLSLGLPQPLAVFDLELAAAASAMATAYYAALTGFAVPAQRSLLMIVVALALLASRRSVGALQGLAAALLAVLVWDPFAPLTASFWLSFVAVALMLGLAAPRGPHAANETRLRRAARVARALLGLQWSIGLALLPLTALFFAEISVIGPLVNLAAIPAFNLVLVPITLVATLACTFDGLASSVAPALVVAAGWVASHTVAVLHRLAELDWAAIAVAPPIGALVIAALGVLLAAPANPLPGRRLAWLALLPMFVAPPRTPPPGAVTITALDVGHGLAVIVETHAHRLLFDAGPSFRSGFDSGEEVVLPALAAGGRRALDRLIVSHADNDHAGGARAILAAYPDARVMHGPDVRDLQGEVCASGQEWYWDGVRFAILHPKKEFAARGNDSSCVLKIDASGGSVLLTGDIEARGEDAVQRLADVTADVVVVPHHGSATSSSVGFVRAVGARYAVVSAGYANRWGFPKPEVRARWERSGAELVVTGDAGAVIVAIGAGGPKLLRERDARHRYWQTFAVSSAGAGSSW